MGGGRWELSVHKHPTPQVPDSLPKRTNDMPSTTFPSPKLAWRYHSQAKKEEWLLKFKYEFHLRA